MDTVGYDIGGTVPALEGLPRYNSDGAGGAHLYMPWWGWERQEALGFPRGYHIEIGGGYGMPGIGAFGGAARRAGYGVAIKEQARRDYGTRVSFAGRGEMIPNEQSFCEIDPDVVDRFGIPVLRFHFRWSDHERRQARHMRETFTELITSMGGEPQAPGARDASGISIGGSIIHEVGTVRMGNDPRTSALNGFCQSHDAPNLFVCDAASFVSNPDKNPTLTINALAWRASELPRRGVAQRRPLNRDREPCGDRSEWSWHRDDDRRDRGHAARGAAAVGAGGHRDGGRAFNIDAARVVHALAGEARAQAGGYSPAALSAHQFRTVTRLAELIVPADAGGGSAVEAGAPEFIDLLCSQNPDLMGIYADGLEWLDAATRRAHDRDVRRRERRAADGRCWTDWSPPNAASRRLRICGTAWASSTGSAG